MIPTNICSNCISKKICKIYDTITSNEVRITLATCGHKIADDSVSVLADLHSYDTIKKTIENKEEPAIKDDVRFSRASQDITELSNKIKAEKDAKVKSKVKAPELTVLGETQENGDVAKESCPSCEEMTYSIIKCPICSKDICASCSMVSINDSGVAQTICEECWKTDAELTNSLIIKDKELVKEKTKTKRGRPSKK